METDAQAKEKVIRFSCSHCGAPLTVEADLAGITGPCPSCGQSMTAPGRPKESSPSPKSLAPAAESQSSSPSKPIVPPKPVVAPKPSVVSKPAETPQPLVTPQPAKPALVQPVTSGTVAPVSAAKKPELPVTPESGLPTSQEPVEEKIESAKPAADSRRTEVRRERSEVALVIRAMFLGLVLLSLAVALVWWLSQQMGSAG